MGNVGTLFGDQGVLLSLLIALLQGKALKEREVGLGRGWAGASHLV